MPENKGQIFEDQISTWLKKVEAGRKYNGELENVAVTLARLPYWKGEGENRVRFRLGSRPSEWVQEGVLFRKNVSFSDPRHATERTGWVRR